MIGHTISQYRIIEKRGGGRMAVVYNAEDVKLSRSSDGWETIRAKKGGSQNPAQPAASFVVQVFDSGGCFRRRAPQFRFCTLTF